MQLRYDSLNDFKTPEELVFRLRLWTDPAFKKSPILMASQAQGWNGTSVVNASEDIYSYFMSQEILDSVESRDQEVIKKIAGFDLIRVLSRLQKNFSNGLFNAGQMHDEVSALIWLGPKIGSCLNETKSHIKNYICESKELSLTYKSILFIEHFPSQPGLIQDWFAKEKFFVVSYAEGFRDEQCILMSHSALQREYGIENL